LLFLVYLQNFLSLSELNFGEHLDDLLLVQHHVSPQLIDGLMMLANQFVELIQLVFEWLNRIRRLPVEK
jgi:hypothetical protein